jgi:ribose transport system substrate-binding protein
MYFLSFSIIAVALAAIYYRQSTQPESPAARPKTTRIALLTAHTDSFWDIVVEGARDAAKQFNAVVDVQVPEEGVEGANTQTMRLVNLDTEKFDALALSPRSPDEQTLLISKLAEKMFVVTVDNDAPQSIRHLHIGTNNTSAGGLAAELIQRAVPEGGEIAIFVGDNERQNARDRRSAIISALAGKEDDSRAADADIMKPIEVGEFTIVGSYLDGGDEEKAVANVEQALSDHPDLVCMVALYGYNGPACLDGLKKAGKVGNVKIVAFDQHEATLRGIEAGEIIGTVVQDPYRYGFEAVRVLTRFHCDEEFAVPNRGAGAILLPCSIVDQQSLEDYRKKRTTGSSREAA